MAVKWFWRSEERRNICKSYLHSGIGWGFSNYCTSAGVKLVLWMLHRLLRPCFSGSSSQSFDITWKCST